MDDFALLSSHVRQLTATAERNLSSLIDRLSDSSEDSMRVINNVDILSGQFSNLSITTNTLAVSLLTFEV